MEITLIIPGDPVPKQSIRMGIAQKKTGEYYPVAKQTKKIKNTETAYKWIIKSQLPKKVFPVSCPIRVLEINYMFKAGKEVTAVVIPGETPIYRFTTPDVQDNLNKLLFDAMKGIVYKDDCQVIEINNIRKTYGHSGQLYVRLEILEDYKLIKKGALE